MKRLIALLCALATTPVWAQVEVGSKLLMTPDEMKFVPANPALPAGLATAVIAGDPSKSGVYVLRVRIPPNFKIDVHTHPDPWRTATVISGTIYYAYGSTFDESRLKALGPGSFLIEPKNEPHFALTKGEEAVVQVTAEGPTATFPVRR